MRKTKSGRACLTKANLNRVGINRVRKVDYADEGVGWDFYGVKEVKFLPPIKDPMEFTFNKDQLTTAWKKLGFKKEYDFLRALEKAKTQGVYNMAHGSFSAFQ